MMHLFGLSVHSACLINLVQINAEALSQISFVRALQTQRFEVTITGEEILRRACF